MTRSRSHVILASCVTLFGLFNLACIEQVQPMEAEQACEEAAYAMSARVLECTEDEDRAMAIWEDAGRMPCAASWVGFEGAAEDFKCTAEISAVTCQDANLYGDDPRAWVAALPACTDLFGEGGTGGVL